MRTRKTKDRARLIKAALGELQCDLTIKNIQLFNVFTGEIYPAEVDILDGFVVRLREDGQEQTLESKETYDGQGKYLIPGYIDAHVHVESTMMIPENMSRAVVPWGTTTICTDPHEIGNVTGIDGVKFMLDNAKKSTLRQYVLAPSCVPAVPGVENAGADFLAEEVGKILDMDDVIGVAEIMDYVGVINNVDRMRTIIEEGEKRGAYLQGHSPRVMGKELAAYRIGGPVSDHESRFSEEVQEKLRNGFHINLRASTLANNLVPLVEGFKNHPWQDQVSVCTDDVHAKDLLTLGHVNKVLRFAVEAGLDPMIATKMATYNAAREYGFDDLGAIAPGYIADMQIVNDFCGSMPEAVFIEGKLVAEKGEYVAGDKLEEAYELENTVKIDYIKSADDLKLKVPAGYTKNSIVVNVVTPLGNGLRDVVPCELPVVDGAVDISGDDSLTYVCCINRHGREQMAISVYRDLPMIKGALASTVSHDSHNLCICYKTAEDAFISCNVLKECGGGICVVNNGVESHLVLDVAGLMSQKGCEEIAADIDRVQEEVDKIMNGNVSLLMSITFSLPVIPGVVVTDVGIVDGRTQELIDCFAV